MQNLNPGQFFGQINETLHIEGITLTDTEYTHAKVDWHFHENAYFTFILEGSMLEGNKKEVYHCAPGSLLFHNWQDAHYNEKSNRFTRGFHVEFGKAWFDSFGLDLNTIQGSINIVNPESKLLMHQIFKETKIRDTASNAAIQSLLLEMITGMIFVHKTMEQKKPSWVKRLTDILNDLPNENWSLKALADCLGIHPVHLSRDFKKYFHCNLGEYIRAIRMQRSLSLLSNGRLSLTDIALQSGFADQSHFIRCFKLANKIRPSQYRRLIAN